MMVEALGIHQLWLFVLSGVLLNVTPGPDTAYIIGRSVQMGWRGGAAAAIGICCGCLVHVFGAAVGLSALLMASSAAFAVLKWVGAAYLLVTGIQMLLSRPHPAADQAAAPAETSLSRVFWQGALTNILNPKVALFFLAFLPQFVHADAGHVTLQFLTLSLAFNLSGTIVNALVALGVSHVRGWLTGSSRAQLVLRRVPGVVFIGLGARLAMDRAR
jgi:threonine/homoserine/homoserine lactone efflux protein